MKMKTLSSLAALIVAAAMLAGCGGTGNTDNSQGQTTTDAVTEDVSGAAIKNMTSLEMIRAMGNGINLGNTLEAYNHNSYVSGSDPDGFETIWG